MSIIMGEKANMVDEYYNGRKSEYGRRRKGDG